MALSDELLMKVEQPARYLGNEVNAANKDKSKAEAYTGLANIYVAQDDLDSAESVYLNALETQPSNVNLYKAAVKFYEKTEQPNKISDLLQDCEDKNVLSAMNDYVSSAPEFSLKEGTYDEVHFRKMSSMQCTEVCRDWNMRRSCEMRMRSSMTALMRDS